MRADVLRGFRSELEKDAVLATVGAKILGFGAKLFGRTVAKGAGGAARMGKKAVGYAAKNPIKSVGAGVTGYEGSSAAIKGLRNPHTTTLNRFRKNPTKSLY